MPYGKFLWLCRVIYVISDVNCFNNEYSSLSVTVLFKIKSGSDVEVD